MHIAGLGNVAHHILADHGAWLVAEGIDARTVVHVLSIIIDQVRMNLIVFHTDRIAVPAPSQGNACILYIVDGIMLNVDITDIAGSNGYAAPVVVGNIAKLRLLNGLAVTHLTCVFGPIGKMSL